MIKQILRKLWRSWFLNTINLVGIVIGLTTCTILLLYVKTEYQADKCFNDYENIYRFDSQWGSTISYKHINLFKENITEIKDVTIYQYSWSWQDLIFYKGKNYKVDDLVYADSSFFKVFQFKALAGNIEGALHKPYSMVLTRKQAVRIFGAIDVVGETVPLKTSDFGINNYTVTAVIDDIPTNSSLSFQSVVSLEDLMGLDWYKNNADHWGTFNFTGFALLYDNTNSIDVDEKINEVCLANAPQWSHDVVPFRLEGLAGLHFKETGSDGVFTGGNKALVNLLGAIGCFILLLAAINYLNLNISQIDQSNKLIGISKIVGAGRMSIAVQSMLSTSVIFILAIVLTIWAIIILLPCFNSIASTEFSLSSLIAPSNLIFFIGTIIISGILFGFFPAMIVSKLKPISMLQKKSAFSRNNSLMPVLVVFQFVLTIVLIASTILIQKQNEYLLTTDYGINRENILYIPQSPDIQGKMGILENEIENIPGVDEVAFGSEVFGTISQSWGRKLYGDGKARDVNFTNMWVNEDFFKLFDIRVLSGMNFNESSGKKQDIIYNEAFVQKYNLEEPLTTSLVQSHDKYNTIGIVKNFNFGTLRESISPLALMCSDNSNLSTVFVKVHSSNTKQTQDILASIEGIWEHLSPNYPFEYKFMDTHYAEIYEDEIQMSNILAVASVLSIVLASLGLFCLSYFIIGKRIKEIGVRKVNGAKVFEVLALVNGSFVKWVLIAFVIATPIAYFAMQKWLAIYAYKTGLNWWVFILAGGLAILVSVLTVSWQSWRAARRNPVEALRYE